MPNSASHNQAVLYTMVLPPLLRFLQRLQCHFPTMSTILNLDSAARLKGSRITMGRHGYLGGRTCVATTGSVCVA